MSKVLLINPEDSELASHGNSQVPVGYLYLAAECLRLGHQVRFVDGIISSNREIRDSFKLSCHRCNESKTPVSDSLQ